MNIKELKEIIEIFENSNITELDLERQGVRIRLKRDASENSAAVEIEQGEQAEKPAEGPGEGSSEIAENTVEIKTPMVGTFYRSPAPDAEPFIEEGDIIQEGDVICIIEAMKLMNEIKSEIKGKILKILVENGQAVEFSQPLFLVEAQ